MGQKKSVFKVLFCASTFFTLYNLNLTELLRLLMSILLAGCVFLSVLVLIFVKNCLVGFSFSSVLFRLLSD